MSEWYSELYAERRPRRIVLFCVISVLVFAAYFTAYYMAVGVSYVIADTFDEGSYLLIEPTYSSNKQLDLCLSAIFHPAHLADKRIRTWKWQPLP